MSGPEPTRGVGCPTPEMIRAFCDGGLDDDALIERIGAHLGACPQCARRAELLDDAIAQALGGRSEWDDVAAELRRPPRDSTSSASSEEAPTVTIEEDHGGPWGGASRGAGSLPVRQSIGRFRVLAPLGRGAHGDVYHCRDLELGRDVAVKVPRADLPETQARRLLRGEAQGVAPLLHPGVVPLLETSRPGDAEDYLVFELVESGTLQDRIDRGPWSQREAAEIALQIAETLAYAHDLGIYHRDLKPSNILLIQGVGSARQVARLIDFGVAFRGARHGVRANGVEDNLEAGRSGEVVGTDTYMSPEQLRGLAPSAGSDIWSLGVVLYQLLAGRPPFRESGEALRRQILQGRPTPLGELRDDVVPELAGICSRCLQLDLGQRYASLHVLCKELREWLHSTVPATAVGRPTPPKHKSPAIKRTAPRRTAWIAGAIVIALLVFGPRMGRLLHGTASVVAPSPWWLEESFLATLGPDCHACLDGLRLDSPAEFSWQPAGDSRLLTGVLTCALRRADWESPGQVGLYFGGRVALRDEQPVWITNAVIYDAERGVLGRGVWERPRDDPHAPPRKIAESILNVSTPEPLVDHPLRLTFSNGWLMWVEWGGTRLDLPPPALDAEDSTGYRDGDFEGEWGVVAQGEPILFCQPVLE